MKPNTNKFPCTEVFPKWGDLEGCLDHLIIKITTKDGKIIVRNIWCENDADYRRLKSLGGFLEEKGINVKMKGFERE